jgi:serine/threonine-protein kinase
MARVYLAQDLKHDREVALKVLHPELATSLGPERFQREIRTTARLQHPHILPVLDSGESAGQLWYTMPYVRGESLRDRLRREGQLPVDPAIDLTKQVALALDYAHREGVIHRDLKPENILLADGQALVADFGVAKAMNAAGEGRLTETGLALGTPAYMSPEQATGGAVDTRTDVYALGCVLYEMLAGEPPYTGLTPQAVLAKRVLEPVPHVRTLRESVPEALERILMRALAKSPADRFQTGGEFARAVAGIGMPPASTPARTVVVPPVTGATVRRTVHRRVLVAMGTLGLGFVMALGVLSGWLWSHRAKTAGASTVLAVLPFENQGAAQDEYFADGVTDAVRGKLATLDGVEVIAAESSSPYKGTHKRPEMVARELGARYLLTGTVRWDKARGASRVLVSPELVEVIPGRTPKAKWQEAFHASLTDVFQVQADIAGRVADALDIAIGTPERNALQIKPTTDADAYDYYLRGNAYADRGDAEPDLRKAEGLYEQAAAADPHFALAYAMLARTEDNMYWTVEHTEQRLAKAKAAADRALQLQPELAEGHVALGFYHYHGHRDYARALREFEVARRLQPSNAQVYFAIGLVHRREGKWVEAVAALKKAVQLNPRSAFVITQLAWTQIWVRAYAEAETNFVRALQIDPDRGVAYSWNSMLYLLWRGDTAAAARVIRVALRTAGAERVLPGFYSDVGGWLVSSLLGGVLFDSALARVPVAAFGSDTAGYYRWKAGFHDYQRHPDKARAYFDSARAVLAARAARRLPEAAETHALLGAVDAELGRRAEARAEGEQAVALRPMSLDAVDGVVYRLNLARILAKIGAAQAATDQLAYLLSVPAPISVPLLDVDHTWDALRSNPRFRSLLNGS